MSTKPLLPLLFAAALLSAGLTGGCQSDPQERSEKRADKRQPDKGSGSPLPEVATGDPGPMPGKGRPWRWDERNRYGLGGKYWRFTDESQDSQYNCLAFATCSQIFGWMHFADNAPDNMESADRHFLGRGWTISADCKPRKGVRKVVAYCAPELNQRVDPTDPVVHFAKQYRDDWWEGKMGCTQVGGTQPPRILYPGVGSISYAGGVPCRCYEMSLVRLIAYIKSTVFPEIERQRKNLGYSTPDMDRAEQEAKDRISELVKAIATEGPGP